MPTRPLPQVTAPTELLAVLPERAVDDIVAVAQRGHAGAGDFIAARGADQAVGRRRRPRWLPAGAADPGGGADGHAAVLPVGAADDEVAVGQRRHAAAADEIAAGRAGQRAEQRPGLAVVEEDRSGIGRHGAVGGIGDDHVAVAQHHDVAAERVDSGIERVGADQVELGQARGHQRPIFEDFQA